MRWQEDRMSNALDRLGENRHPGKAIPVVVAAVAVLIIGVLVYRANTPSDIDVRSAADSAAYELERTPVPGLGVTTYDVQRALADGTRDSRGRSATGIKVRDAGSDSRGELFEITNRKGQHPVCLVVSLPDVLGADPAFPVATVDDGPCP
jgi:hypothetical protein